MPPQPQPVLCVTKVAYTIYAYLKTLTFRTSEHSKTLSGGFKKNTPVTNYAEDMVILLYGI